MGSGLMGTRRRGASNANDQATSHRNYRGPREPLENARSRMGNPNVRMPGWRGAQAAPGDRLKYLLRRARTFSVRERAEQTMGVPRVVQHRRGEPPGPRPLGSCNGLPYQRHWQPLVSLVPFWRPSIPCNGPGHLPRLRIDQTCPTLDADQGTRPHQGRGALDGSQKSHNSLVRDDGEREPSQMGTVVLSHLHRGPPAWQEMPRPHARQRMRRLPSLLGSTHHRDRVRGKQR